MFYQLKVIRKKSKPLEQIKMGEGITCSEHIKDRDIHTKKSATAQSKPTRRECKLETFLKSYDKAEEENDA